MKAVAAERRRFGYRRIHIMLERQGIAMNLKKLRRLYCEEKLQVRRRGGRKRALGTRRPMLLPDAPNIRWSLDFVSDALTDGHRFRVLAVVDDYSRECLALVDDTSLSGHRVARELDAVVARRGRPAMVVSDNGTELTSMAILSWCQRTAVEWPYIAPGKPMRDTASSRASTGGSATSCSTKHCSHRSARRGSRSALGNTTTTTTAHTPASGTSRRPSSWRRRAWKCAPRSPRNQPADSPETRRRVGAQVNDDQRSLQDRGHPSSRAVAQFRSSRTCHPRMGGLVRQSPAARADRKHPAFGS